MEELIKNYRWQAIKKLPKKDWMQEVEEVRKVARKYRSEYKKLPRIDLRKLGGNNVEPEVLKVKFLSEPKTIKTENMKKPMDVVEIEVLLSSKEDIKCGKYSVWISTKGLRDEMKNLCYPVKDAPPKPIVDKIALICSYGKTKTKSGNPFYVFKIIEQ